MEKSIDRFSGEAAASYDQYLGPLLFEPFATHVAAMYANPSTENILEIACGTGRLTACILAKVNADTVITATDINADMLAIASEKISAKNVKFLEADAHDLKFEDDYFDIIFCQFGLMFFKDKNLALGEIKRVLKPGGKFIFSTWDKPEHSPLINTVFKNNLEPYIKEEQHKSFYMPFSMYDVGAIQALIYNAGFTACSVKPIMLQAGKVDSMDIVNGFFLKSPLYNQIASTEPDAIEFIVSEMGEQIARGRRDNASFMNLSAFVGEAIK